MLAVGHAAYARKDWPAAMTAFQRSAEAGSAEGAWELSLMHAHGKTGVVDKEGAKKWLKIAADGGAVQAMMFLAQMSTFGRGGYKKDESMALDLLKRAADQGNAHATHQLGVRYLYAVGVEQDLDKAIEQFDRAIELGSTDAVKDLKIAQKKKKSGKRAFVIAQGGGGGGSSSRAAKPGALDFGSLNEKLEKEKKKKDFSANRKAHYNMGAIWKQRKAALADEDENTARVTDR